MSTKIKRERKGSLSPSKFRKLSTPINVENKGQDPSPSQKLESKKKKIKIIKDTLKKKRTVIKENRKTAKVDWKGIGEKSKNRKKKKLKNTRIVGVDDDPTMRSRSQSVVPILNLAQAGKMVVLDSKKTQEEIDKNIFGFSFFEDGIKPEALPFIFKYFNLAFICRIFLISVGILAFQSSPFMQILMLFSTEVAYFCLNLIT
jgi:hypothetical protein